MLDFYGGKCYNIYMNKLLDIIRLQPIKLFSIAALSKRLGISYNAVRKRLKKLEEAGLIKIECRCIKGTTIKRLYITEIKKEV